MRKKANIFQTGMLFTMLVFFSPLYLIAQSNTISISVIRVEYDNPYFLLLKGSLQRNKNVTSVKTGYEQGTAKLSFSFTHNAQDLWDELPKSTKDYFKIITINDNGIVLERKNPVKEETPELKNNTTTSAKDDDCRNCYFNLCKYDGIKTFQGVVYKAINYDEGTFYYNCDNGILTRKVITVNGYGVTTGITTDTILMSNVPIGTTWHVINTKLNFLGSEGYSRLKYTLVGKGLTTTVNGTTYKDVIVVNFFQKSQDILEGVVATSINYFYAKGVGLIKEEKLNPNIEPLSTIHVSNKPVELPNLPEMKGVIDPGLVGTWVDKDPSGFIYTYKFYADGTYETFVGSTLSYNGSKCFWRLDGGYINLYCTGWPKVYRQEFQKINDAATGKRAIVIQFKDTEYRTYISEDGKATWTK
ncbi:hypothetical protein CLV51_10925 [Chitinophaga niastensis]|uniref:Uncharacterized protein n=1 Tax=Chitinophaga niastensis TaxID=536980 RepID=A0A2P8HA08_CHINA|nr:hypothetical protein [Chitinophaga niastensis]PSL43031.1 hypothetical protein CLV51_10925 [Chitinophaga niastensis]